MTTKTRVRVLRTYRFVDKDPVIDMCRIMLQDLGLFSKKNMAKVAALASLHGNTLHNMFFGDTRRPQHATVMALITACGFEITLKQARKLNFEEELTFARAWNKKQHARLKTMRPRKVAKRRRAA
jgi:DNA-binding phage protein